MLLLSKYKWYIAAGLLAVWTLGVWHVAGTYATASLVKEQLAANNYNDELAKKVMSVIADKTDAWNEQSKKNTKALLDEILKDPRYKSCRTTDGVRDALQRKLDAQPD